MFSPFNHDMCSFQLAWAVILSDFFLSFQLTENVSSSNSFWSFVVWGLSLCSTVKILSTFSPQITWPTANSIIRDFDFKFIKMKVHARLVKLKRDRKHFQAVNSSLSISWFSWIGQGHKASNGRWDCYVGMYRGFKKNIFQTKNLPRKSVTLVKVFTDCAALIL